MRLLFLITLLFIGSFAVSGQCVASAGYQCVPQADVDRATKDLKELITLRDLYSKLLAERPLTDAERAASVNIVKIAQDTIAILQHGIADRDAVIELQQKALQLYSDLVQKLTDQLNKPKSSWSKFMEAAREVIYIAGGILIGRAMP